MKRRQWHAAVSAFVITLILLGSVAGFLLADRRTAHMTFGSETQPLSLPDDVLLSVADKAYMAKWQKISTVLPARFRAVLWVEQIQFDTMSYWIKQFLS